MQRGQLAPEPVAEHSVARLSILSFAATVADRLLALVLIAIIASLYGASASTDRYFVAVVVPTALGGALGEATYAVGLPLFTRAVAARSPLRYVTVLTAAAGAGVAGAYVVVIAAVSPRDEALWLSLAPIIAVLTLGGILSSYLVANGRYTLAIMRLPIASGGALLLLAVLQPLNPGIRTVALAVLAGYLLSTAVLLIRTFWRQPRAGTPVRVPRREFLGATGSALASALVGGPVVVVVERLLASGLEAGAVSVLTFARNLALLPLMLTQALASGVFPLATVRHARVERAALDRLIVQSLRLGLALGVALAALIMMATRDVVRLALERGALDAQDAATTAHLMRVLAPSALGLTCSVIAARALFAHGAFRVVGLVSLLTLGLYAATAVGLRAAVGVDGLAIAFLVSSSFGGVVSLAVLFGRLRSIPRRPLLAAGATAAGAGGLAVAGAYALGLALDAAASDSLGASGRLGALLLGALAGGYVAAAVLQRTRFALLPARIRLPRPRGLR